MKGISFAAILGAFAAFTANAGILNNGNWSPSGCGARPEAPVIDSTSVDAFNRSINMINTWQKQIQTYHDCMVREANADAAAINQAAAAEQAKINAASEKLNSDANIARNKLDSSPARGPVNGPPLGSGMERQGY
ncbi:hypothetical protein [Nitrosovibrio tenuis]|uniref:Uncharacterized protein n=1 Tax=Nitrosovibrio tenuis TaxID=1233 RepID=A0A1H7ISW5_9PROT|nr:hypothetical protein [Nitrosovibrio tenuis]SEK65002.1 hypothetical protein SAMN05216387_102273 [Nitrosovibrio tenuis]